jgi:hypothetical protein
VLLPLIALALAVDPSAPPVTGPRVVVVDVSAPDAVYEDVSRALAEDVVAALKTAGLEAVRIGENELPEQGCRIGPCLGQVAREQKARVVVILEATELDKTRTSVSLAAMAGHNGMPISAKRYVVKSGGKPPKELKAFATDLATRVLPPPVDAGAPPGK